MHISLLKALISPAGKLPPFNPEIPTETFPGKMGHHFWSSVLKCLFRLWEKQGCELAPVAEMENPPHS